MADSLVKEKLQSIGQMLAQSSKNENIWLYSWAGTYTAATIVQGALFANSNDKATRQDMALGAATTALGALGQLITPLKSSKSIKKLALLPEATPNERLIKLQKAEILFKESALGEKSGRAWQTHAINGAVNLGSAIITWVAFDRDVWAGLTNFALNTLISELLIFTQPVRLMKNYKKYQNKYYSPQAFYNQAKAIWSVSVYPQGIKISLVF